MPDNVPEVKLTPEEERIESAYVSGLAAGWNCGVGENKERFLQIYNAHTAHKRTTQCLTDEAKSSS